MPSVVKCRSAAYSFAYAPGGMMLTICSGISACRSSRVIGAGRKALRRSARSYTNFPLLLKRRWRSRPRLRIRVRRLECAGRRTEQELIDNVGPEAWQERATVGQEPGACGFHPCPKNFFWLQNLASQKKASDSVFAAAARSYGKHCSAFFCLCFFNSPRFSFEPKCLRRNITLRHSPYCLSNPLL